MQTVPLTDAEKQYVARKAGPHRTVEFTFHRFDAKGRPSQHGRLRAVRARILSNYEAKRL